MAAVPASAAAWGVGYCSRKLGHRVSTRETCVCCNINSATTTAQGSRVLRHGRSLRFCCIQVHASAIRSCRMASCSKSFSKLSKLGSPRSVFREPEAGLTRKTLPTGKFVKESHPAVLPTMPSFSAETERCPNSCNPLRLSSFGVWLLWVLKSIC